MTDRIPAHGTPGRYQGPRRHQRWQACRCQDCRAAARRAEKTQELRRLRGIPGYVDSTIVATHIRSLLDAGWSGQQIADAAKVGRKTIWNVLNGRVRRVQIGNAQALLRLKTVPRPDGRRPALGATRRLHALAAMGWSLNWAAQHTGLTDTAIRDISAGRTKSVHAAHFDAIDALFRSHAMSLGPSAEARNAARRKQWPTALAWDDIDNPAETPCIALHHYRPKPARPRLRLVPTTRKDAA